MWVCGQAYCPYSCPWAAWLFLVLGCCIHEHPYCIFWCVHTVSSAGALRNELTGHFFPCGTDGLWKSCPWFLASCLSPASTAGWGLLSWAFFSTSGPQCMLAIELQGSWIQKLSSPRPLSLQRLLSSLVMEVKAHTGVAVNWQLI